MKAADLELRPATLDDAAFVADVDTAVFPDDPEDPQMLRHYWTMWAPDSTVERFVASRSKFERVYSLYGAKRALPASSCDTRKYAAPE